MNKGRLRNSLALFGLEIFFEYPESYLGSKITVTTTGLKKNSPRHALYLVLHIAEGKVSHVYVFFPLQTPDNFNAVE